MFLKEILDGLYTTDANSIIAIINKSSCAADCADDNHEHDIIHLGFTFKNHVGNIFELLYNISNQRLIRQMQVKLPCILGLSCKYEGKYLKKHKELLIEGVSTDDANILADGADCYLPITDERFFQVFSVENSEPLVFAKYPLQKQFSEPLFFYQGKFSLYISEGQRKRESESYWEDQVDQINERKQQLRDNFDAMTDGQMGSYDDLYN